MAIQLLINSLVIFSQYSIIGYGYILVTKFTKIPHFAHGAIVAFGAYFYWFCITSLALNFFQSLILTLVFCTLLMHTVLKLVYLPFWKNERSKTVLLVASLSLIIILENSIKLLYGSSVKFLNTNYQNTVFEIINAYITWFQILTIIVNIIVFTILFILVYKSRIGLKWQGFADNTKVFQNHGFDQSNQLLGIFATVGIFVTIGSVMLALDFSLTPELGTNLFLKSFVGATFANNELKFFWLTSLVLVSFETIFTWFYPTDLKEIFVYGSLLVWILIKNKFRIV